VTGMTNTAQQSARSLRMGILALTRTGAITSAEAEVWMNHVQALEHLALAGLMAAGMGTAATSRPRAPMPKAVDHAVGKTKWATHEQRSAGGTPPPRESKRDREARKQAEAIGMQSGQYTGRPRGGS
jgi:hypothetical protein